jgi:predicted GIY-YIG superfamily endonuclease
MAIVYLHKKKDTNEIFYVGIGTNTKRAYTKHKRSGLWKKIVKKYGYDIIITHDNICWEEACSIEKYLISFYGRMDIKTGILTNMTEGGDGTFGRVCLEETKQKISVKAKKKLSCKENHPMYGRSQTKESNEKNRNSQLGEKSYMFGKKGKLHPRFGVKHSLEERQKMKIRNIGIGNPNYGNRGGKNPISKKIICYKDGKYYEYNSITEASIDKNCHAQSISNCCLKKQYQTKGYRFKFFNDESFIGELVKQKRKKRFKNANSHKSITTIS